MQFREVPVPGAWEITPQKFSDPRRASIECHAFRPLLGDQASVTAGVLPVCGPGDAHASDLDRGLLK